MKEEIQVTLQTETRWGFGIFLVVTFLMALYGLCLGLTVFLAPHLVIGLPWLVSWYIVEIIIGILIVLHFAFYMYLLFRDSEDSLQAFLGIFLGIAGFFVLGAGISALTEKNIATYSSVAFVMICLSMVLDVVLMIRNKE